MSKLHNYLGKRYSSFWGVAVNRYVFSGLAITICGTAISLWASPIDEVGNGLCFTGVLLGGFGLGFDKAARKEANRQ